MRVAIFFVLLATIYPAFGVSENESSSDAVPKTFVSACELNFPKSEVIVNFQDGVVEEDNQKSIKSLTALARKSNVIHSGENITLGLTTSELSWSINSEFKSMRLASVDMHCARPKIKIELGVLYHIVHVAKEFSPQSCAYNFVRDHEYKHVNLNKDNMQRYSKEIAIAFNEHFSNNILYGPIEKINSEAQKAMDNEWLPFIKEVAAKMENEGMERHKTIDTPEEYAKGSTACSGKVSAIVQASEKK